MSEFFDYDPLTGIRYDTAQHDDITVVHRSQDVGALVDRIRAQANEGVTDKGIKNGFWKVAEVPAVVQLELIKKGIDFPPKDEAGFTKMMKELKSNYPYLLTTSKRVA